jgi:hypothetical protein
MYSCCTVFLPLHLQQQQQKRQTTKTPTAAIESKTKTTVIHVPVSVIEQTPAASFCTIQSKKKGGQVHLVTSAQPVIAQYEAETFEETKSTRKSETSNILFRNKSRARVLNRQVSNKLFSF